MDVMGAMRDWRSITGGNKSFASITSGGGQFSSSSKTHLPVILLPSSVRQGQSSRHMQEPSKILSANKVHSRTVEDSLG